MLLSTVQQDREIHNPDLGIGPNTDSICQKDTDRILLSEFSM